MDEFEQVLRELISSAERLSCEGDNISEYRHLKKQLLALYKNKRCTKCQGECDE